MADILSMTAPLLVKLPDGHKCLVAEKYQHPDGILVFEPFWMDDISRCHLLAGEISGNGPWRVGDNVVSVLGCSDPELSMLWTQWDELLANHDESYQSLLLHTARSLGALI
jgi:hypothetical protein